MPHIHRHGMIWYWYPDKISFLLGLSFARHCALDIRTLRINILKAHVTESRFYRVNRSGVENGGSNPSVGSINTLCVTPVIGQ